MLAIGLVYLIFGPENKKEVRNHGGDNHKEEDQIINRHCNQR